MKGAIGLWLNTQAILFNIYQLAKNEQNLPSRFGDRDIMVSANHIPSYLWAKADAQWRFLRFQVAGLPSTVIMTSQSSGKRNLNLPTSAFSYPLMCGDVTIIALLWREVKSFFFSDCQDHSKLWPLYRKDFSRLDECKHLQGQYPINNRWKLSFNRSIWDCFTLQSSNSVSMKFISFDRPNCFMCLHKMVKYNLWFS